MSEINRELVYMAGLLHDIGKFYQRADDNGAARSKELDQFVKDNEGNYCPMNSNGQLTHKHVLWTAQFLIDHEKVFKSVTKANQYDKTAKDSFFRMAVQHHKPGSDLEKLVQFADHFSSGVDRTQSEGVEDAEDELKWDGFKQKRMVSIFEGLLQGNDAVYKHRLPIEGISLKEEKYFPRKNEDFSVKASEQYRNQWRNFTDDFKKINVTGFRAFINTLLAVLHKHTATIPSSTMHLRDVSLYDHLKTTAAFAICLYDYLVEKDRLQKPQIKAEDEPVLLVGGDISGIQKYIYDIISSDAAKNLKGRSFYLQLLAESVVQYILEKMDLCNANIVYASGGGFFLLVPNTKENQEKLTGIEQHLTKNLFLEHGTSLYLALDYEPVSQAKIFSQNIGEAWKELIRKLSTKKRQRYKSFLLGNDPVLNFTKFFEEGKVNGDELRDRITNEPIIPPEKPRWIKNDKAKPIRWLTDKQIRLGKELKKTQYIVCTSEPITYWQNELMFNPCDTRNFYYFTNDDKVYDRFFKAEASVQQARITKINELEFLKEDFPGKENTLLFDFYGGDNFPVFEDDVEDREGKILYEAGEIKDFDALAGIEDGKLKRLGILRMDVDSLGQIFIHGFEQQMKTFSRYSTLSRNLDYFFKGYLNTIWNSKEEYKKNTYILYAGGDDLFIVGKWNYLIDFAEEIQSHFKKWTCHNPKLGLSGGIAIVGGKFPIAKGALMAETAEKKAKQHRVGELEKNAFCLLGYPLHWDIEYSVVKDLKEQLLTFIENDGLPKALLSKIKTFHTMKTEQQIKKKTESWRWLLAYDFGRARQRLKNNQAEAKEFLNMLQTQVFCEDWEGRSKGSQYKYLDLLNIAARWAELEMRT
jgi:CRISPR-associated protein Csm1